MKIKLSTKIALGTFFLFLLITMITAISMTTRAQTNIEANTDHINKCEDIQIKINENLFNHEKRLVTIETNYDHIVTSLDKIDKKLDEVTK